jgi:hypothetical protein
MSHATINSAAAAIGIDRATLIEQLHHLETDSARASTTAPPATATSPPATAATFSPHSTALTSSPYARSEPGYHAHHSADGHPIGRYHSATEHGR